MPCKTAVLVDRSARHGNHQLVCQAAQVPSNERVPPPPPPARQWTLGQVSPIRKIWHVEQGTNCSRRDDAGGGPWAWSVCVRRSFAHRHVQATGTACQAGESVGTSSSCCAYGNVYWKAGATGLALAVTAAGAFKLQQSWGASRGRQAASRATGPHVTGVF